MLILSLKIYRSPSVRIVGILVTVFELLIPAKPALLITRLLVDFKLPAKLSKEDFFASAEIFINFGIATAARIAIKETGQEIEVSPETSMLDALRNNGVTVESVCETGICGKCRVDYEGDVDHKDSVLTKSEKKRCMTPCVSRAKGKELLISIR